MGLRAGCARERQPGVFVGEHSVAARAVLSTSISIYVEDKMVLTLSGFRSRWGMDGPIMNEIIDGLLNLADPFVVSPYGHAEDLTLYEWIRVEFFHEILVCEIRWAREELTVVFETFGHDAIDARE